MCLSVTPQADYEFSTNLKQPSKPAKQDVSWDIDARMVKWGQEIILASPHLRQLFCNSSAHGASAFFGPEEMAQCPNVDGVVAFFVQLAF